MSSAIHSVVDKDDWISQLKGAGTKLVIVYFYATWAEPCQMAYPKLETIVNQTNSDDVLFLKVDVDECGDLASDYLIDTLPTMIVMKNAKKVGECHVETLKDIIEKHIHPEVLCEFSW